MIPEALEHEELTPKSKQKINSLRVIRETHMKSMFGKEIDINKFKKGKYRMLIAKQLEKYSKRDKNPTINITKFKTKSRKR